MINGWVGGWKNEKRSRSISSSSSSSSSSGNEKMDEGSYGWDGLSIDSWMSRSKN